MNNTYLQDLSDSFTSTKSVNILLPSHLSQKLLYLSIMEMPPVFAHGMGGMDDPAPSWCPTKKQKLLGSSTADLVVSSTAVFG